MEGVFYDLFVFVNMKYFEYLLEKGEVVGGVSVYVYGIFVAWSMIG